MILSLSSSSLKFIACSTPWLSPFLILAVKHLWSTSFEDVDSYEALACLDRRREHFFLSLRCPLVRPVTQTGLTGSNREPADFAPFLPWSSEEATRGWVWFSEVIYSYSDTSSSSWSSSSLSSSHIASRSFQRLYASRCIFANFFSSCIEFAKSLSMHSNKRSMTRRLHNKHFFHYLTILTNC